MKNRKGAIATLLTLGLVVVGSLITLGTSLFVSNKKTNLASNSMAASTSYPCSTVKSTYKNGNYYKCGNKYYSDSSCKSEISVGNYCKLLNPEVVAPVTLKCSFKLIQTAKEACGIGNYEGCSDGSYKCKTQSDNTEKCPYGTPHSADSACYPDGFEECAGGGFKCVKEQEEEELHTSGKLNQECLPNGGCATNDLECKNNRCVRKQEEEPILPSGDDSCCLYRCKDKKISSVVMFASMTNNDIPLSSCNGNSNSGGKLYLCSLGGSLTCDRNGNVVSNGSTTTTNPSQTGNNPTGNEDSEVLYPQNSSRTPGMACCFRQGTRVRVYAHADAREASRMDTPCTSAAYGNAYNADAWFECPDSTPDDTTQGEYEASFTGPDEKAPEGCFIAKDATFCKKNGGNDWKYDSVTKQCCEPETLKNVPKGCISIVVKGKLTSSQQHDCISQGNEVKNIDGKYWCCKNEEKAELVQSNAGQEGKPCIPVFSAGRPTFYYCNNKLICTNQNDEGICVESVMQNSPTPKTTSNAIGFVRANGNIYIVNRKNNTITDVRSITSSDFSIKKGTNIGTLNKDDTRGFEYSCTRNITDTIDVTVVYTYQGNIYSQSIRGKCGYDYVVILN